MPSQGTRNAQETAVLRRQTRWYIADAPFEIWLVPYPEIEAPSGGKVRQRGTPRGAQTVRLIPLDRQRTSQRNFFAQVGAGGGAGIQTEVTMEIMGDVDLRIEQGDRFVGPDGTDYEITEVQPEGSAPYLRRAFARGSPKRGT